MENGESAFGDGIEKLTNVLIGMAGELDDLAESLETGDVELAKLAASPLDSISAILNSATGKVMEINKH
jgi:hypothetical protein